MDYSADDLMRIDALAFVKSHPERFLPFHRVDGPSLVMCIVGDIMILTGAVATALTIDAWWVVGATIDWINTASDQDLIRRFEAIVPFPEAGQNSFHCEIILAAFASSLIVFGPSGSCVVKGEMTFAEHVGDLMNLHPEWKRAVAFQIPEAGAAHA